MTNSNLWTWQCLGFWFKRTRGAAGNLLFKEIEILEIYNRNSQSRHRINYWRLARLVLNAEFDMEEVERLTKYNRKLHRRQPIKPIRTEVTKHDPKTLRPIHRDEKTW